jgi:hypothetical protein
MTLRICSTNVVSPKLQRLFQLASIHSTLTRDASPQAKKTKFETKPIEQSLIEAGQESDPQVEGKRTLRHRLHLAAADVLS